MNKFIIKKKISIDKIGLTPKEIGIKDKVEKAAKNHSARSE